MLGHRLDLIISEVFSKLVYSVIEDVKSLCVGQEPPDCLLWQCDLPLERFQFQMWDWCCLPPSVCCRGSWGTSLLTVLPDYEVNLAKPSLKSSSQKVCELESLMWLWSLLWSIPVWTQLCSSSASHKPLFG